MKPNRLLSRSLRFDWMFIALTLALMSVGVALVYSATIAEDASVVELFWFKQIIYFVFGSVFAVALIFVRIDWLKRAAIPLYVLALVLLVVVLFFAGDVVKGAGRWIDLGVFKLQPSEFAKIAYLLIISYWLSKHPVSLYKLKSFIVPFFLFIVPFALVLKQPDLSTALVFIAVTMVGFFFAGLTLTDMFLIVSPVLSVFFSHSQALLFEILWGLLICVVVFALFPPAKAREYLPGPDERSLGRWLPGAAVLDCYWFGWPCRKRLWKRFADKPCLFARRTYGLYL